MILLQNTLWKNAFQLGAWEKIVVTMESTPGNALTEVVVGCQHKNLGLHGVSIQASKTWALKQIWYLNWVSLDVFTEFSEKKYLQIKRFHSNPQPVVKESKIIPRSQTRHRKWEDLFNPPHSCFSDLSDCVNSPNSLNFCSIWRKFHWFDVLLFVWNFS